MTLLTAGTSPTPSLPPKQPSPENSRLLRCFPSQPPCSLSLLGPLVSPSKPNKVTTPPARAAGLPCASSPGPARVLLGARSHTVQLEEHRGALKACCFRSQIVPTASTALLSLARSCASPGSTVTNRLHTEAPRSQSGWRSARRPARTCGARQAGLCRAELRGRSLPVIRAGTKPQEGQGPGSRAQGHILELAGCLGGVWGPGFPSSSHAVESEQRNYFCF